MRFPDLNLNELYRKASARWPRGAPTVVAMIVLLVCVEIYDTAYHQPFWNYLPLTNRNSTLTWALLGAAVWLSLPASTAPRVRPDPVVFSVSLTRTRILAILGIIAAVAFIAAKLGASSNVGASQATQPAYPARYAPANAPGYGVPALNPVPSDNSIQNYLNWQKQQQQQQCATQWQQYQKDYADYAAKNASSSYLPFAPMQPICAP